MSAVTVSCASEADTLAAGQRLATLLEPGDVILLAGRLGAGKTLFTAGVAEGLGVDEPVTSPSFVIARRYEGLVSLVHADVYRLGSMAEFDDLDLDVDDAVLVVEWGHAVAPRVSPDHLVVEFEVTGPTSRVLSFRPEGSWRSRPLEVVRP